VEPESKRQEPHDLVGAEAGAILDFLLEPEREPEYFKKLDGVRLQQFLKIL